MPRVGKKKFEYTKAGKEAADEEAKKTGKKVKISKKGESTLQEMFEKEQDDSKKGKSKDKPDAKKKAKDKKK